MSTHDDDLRLLSDTTAWRQGRVAMNGHRNDHVTGPELAAALRDTRDELHRAVTDSRQGVERAIDLLRQHLVQRLDEVNHKLATQNGRIGKGEVARGELGVRVTNVEREVFHRRRDDNGDPPVADEHVITRRDVLIVAYTLTAAAAILGALWGLLQVIRL